MQSGDAYPDLPIEPAHGRGGPGRSRSDEDAARLRETMQAMEVRDEELRVQTEELAASQVAIEAERLRYRELFDFAPDAYLVTDPHGVIREANLAAECLLGSPALPLAGRPLGTLVARDDRASFRARLAALPHAGRADGWSFAVRTRTHGERRISASAARSQRDAAGAESVRWLLRDVTDQVAAAEAERDLAESQAALAEAEAGRRRLAAVLEETTDAFFSVDAEWRFTYVNRRGEEYWRTPRAEMLGRSIWELYPAMVGSESY
ncbi:MAG TPA: PAS domain S-box protein, partial [Longimicrobiaceae bacterium]|nr:PAS domain S-box protein [Longimicrobiaceae bacterium]